MRRALLIGLLAFGTVAGYASGIAHLQCGWHNDFRYGGYGPQGRWGSCSCPQGARPAAPPGTPVPPTEPKE